jgi:hypothetical protein
MSPVAKAGFVVGMDQASELGREISPTPRFMIGIVHNEVAQQTHSATINDNSRHDIFFFATSCSLISNEAPAQAARKGPVR